MISTSIELVADTLYLTDVILKFFTGIPYLSKIKEEKNEGYTNIGYVNNHKMIALN